MESAGTVTFSDQPAVVISTEVPVSPDVGSVSPCVDDTTPATALTLETTTAPESLVSTAAPTLETAPAPDSEPVAASPQPNRVHRQERRPIPCADFRQRLGNPSHNETMQAAKHMGVRLVPLLHRIPVGVSHNQIIDTYCTYLCFSFMSTNTKKAYPPYEYII